MSKWYDGPGYWGVVTDAVRISEVWSKAVSKFLLKVNK